MNCSKDRGKIISAIQLISSKTSFFHSPFVPRRGYLPPYKNPPGTPSLIMSQSDAIYTPMDGLNVNAQYEKGYYCWTYILMV
jgi:hypothetical protein